MDKVTVQTKNSSHILATIAEGLLLGSGYALWHALQWNGSLGFAVFIVYMYLIRNMLIPVRSMKDAQIQAAIVVPVAVLTSFLVATICKNLVIISPSI